MKHTMLKTAFAVAAVVAVSTAHAIAFTPPYHVNNAAVGKATIQSSGSCKIKQTYENAQWGTVLDSNDNELGYGLITSTGELLGILGDYEYISGFSDKSKDKGQDVYFEDFDSGFTVNVLSSLGDCTILELISSDKTKGTYNYNSKKNEFVLQYVFDGISPYSESTKGTKTTYKAEVFSGKITFKGDYAM